MLSRGHNVLRRSGELFLLLLLRWETLMSERGQKHTTPNTEYSSAADYQFPVKFVPPP
jgi:hypothetical protein